MSIFIKNPAVERKARELAKLKGTTLTAAVEAALDRALAERPTPDRRARTLGELHEATERFRRAVGLDKRKVNATKADFDALWEIPGLETEDGDL